MGAADRHQSEQDIVNLVRGIHGTAADGTPTVFLVGGKYVAQPVAVDGGDVVAAWLDAKGYINPHVEALTLIDFTTAGTNQTGSAVTGLGAFRDADVHVNVSAFTGTSPTLDVYADSRLDGTNWKNLARMTQMTGTGQFFLHLTKRQSGGEGTLTSDAGAGTIRAVGWGDDLRVRANIGGTSPSVSAVISVNLVA